MDKEVNSARRDRIFDSSSWPTFGCTEELSYR
jgi:hypothetical protein